MNRTDHRSEALTTARAEAAGDGDLERVDGFEFRMLSTADDMVDVSTVFRQVWGSTTDLVRLEMLMAISHAEGYVCGVYDMRGGAHHGKIVGASIGLLARHNGSAALHSHVTGILPGMRSSGLGRAVKLHQQQWARERDIDWIVWTFDPLVRHNAWFNIAILGAEVHGYLPSFYGKMTDAINAGDESDRLLVAWDAHHVAEAPRDGSGISVPVDLVPTPEDVVALRRSDPGAVAEWRSRTRRDLSAAIEGGRPILGFSRDGDYIVGPEATRSETR